MIHPILGRAESALHIDEPLSRLRGERILVTGASGGLGSALVSLLRGAGIACVGTDVDTLDVTTSSLVNNTSASALVREATLVLHLAGAKYAGDGEVHPEHALRVNALGTANVLSWGVRTVLASTCKAARPETVYGASKLIAERLTLNAGGSIARFFNVYDTPGNVFETWRRIPQNDPIPVTHCDRYFISSREAIGLLLWAAVLPSGRYVLSDVRLQSMSAVAMALYPRRVKRVIPMRRGDRDIEPFCAEHESVTASGRPGIARVASLHDSDEADGIGQRALLGAV